MLLFIYMCAAVVHEGLTLLLSFCFGIIKVFECSPVPAFFPEQHTVLNILFYYFILPCYCL